MVGVGTADVDNLVSGARSVGFPEREPLDLGLGAVGKLPDSNVDNPGSRITCKAAPLAEVQACVGPQFIRGAHGIESSCRDRGPHQQLGQLASWVTTPHSTFGVSFLLDIQNNPMECWFHCSQRPWAGSEGPTSS